MANRVVLGAFDNTFALRVSKPGYNVLSTTLTAKQLAFSSQWAETANTILKGSITFTSAAYVDVMYGETFTAGNLPSCIFIPRVSSSELSWRRWSVVTQSAKWTAITAGFVRIMTDRVRIMKGDSGPGIGGIVGGTYLITRGGN